MLRDADTAMHRAKHQGGARSVIFGEKMHTLAVTRIKMETELRRALEDGELRVHYQPIRVKPSAEKVKMWDEADRDFDASLAIGQVGEYFRNAPEKFDGKPYLFPDPERLLMWKALWQTKSKPTIAIAWQGGIPKTGAKFRKWTLEQLVPLFKAVDAHWVVLEYKTAMVELEAFQAKYPELDIREYRHATLT